MSEIKEVDRSLCLHKIETNVTYIKYQSNYYLREES